MGVLSGTEGDSAQGQALAHDHATTPENDPRGFKTDVEGVFAQGDKAGVPVFDVTQKEFYDNMKTDRKRLRFTPGTAAQSYHSKTRYNRPFFIRNKDDGFLRKIGGRR